MNTLQIPEFLLEMSQQMRDQDPRATAHPFFQVRCKRYIVTEEGYNESHWELHSSNNDGWPIYSTKRGYDNSSSINDLLEDEPEWCENWVRSMIENCDLKEGDQFADHFDFHDEKQYGTWPDNYYVVHLQEIEETVSTHLTEADAEWFIKRRQHDYPKLYTYAASACWAPQLIELQDWIIGLTADGDESE